MVDVGTKGEETRVDAARDHRRLIAANAIALRRYRMDSGLYEAERICG